MSFQPPNQSNGNGKDIEPQNGSRLPVARNGKGIHPPNEERLRAAKKQAQRFYIMLLVAGLAIGALTSIGIVALIQRLGLTEIPPLVEPAQR